MLHNGFHYNIYVSNELEDIAGEVQISSTKGFIKRSTFSGLELNPQYLSGMPVQYVCVYVCSIHVCMLSRVQLFSTPWTVVRTAPMSMGILQARMLEWVVISSSRGSSWPRDGSCISCALAGGFFTVEPPGKLYAYTIWPRNCTSGHFSQRNKNMCSHKNCMWMFVMSIEALFKINYPKLETIQMSFSWMNG